MADQQSLLEKYLKQYWDHLKNRPGICITSRESVKESIIRYDVKREMKYPGSDLARMCRYKIAAYYDWPEKNIKKDEQSFDCDVAYQTVLQYAIAFPYVLSDGRKIECDKGKKFETLNRERPDLFYFRGDTMNSFATVVHKFLGQYNHKEEDIKNFLAHPTKDGKVTNWNIWGVAKKSKYVTQFSKKRQERHWEACILDHLDYFDSILPEEAKRFIRLNHTIGNFMPVPYKAGAGFNFPRGGVNTNDFWDLALLAIYEWYTQQNDEALKKMLQEEGKNTENAENTNLCKKWLREFGEGLIGWKTFVWKNNMEPFIQDNYGEPKELWKGHFTQNQPLPKTPKQFSEFFINASDWIWERGTMIAEAIMQELEKAPECHPWKTDN